MKKPKLTVEQVIEASKELTTSNIPHTTRNLSKVLNVHPDALYDFYRRSQTPLPTRTNGSKKWTQKQIAEIADQVKAEDGYATYATIGAKLALTKQRVEQIFRLYQLDIRHWKHDYLRTLDELDTTNLTIDEIKERLGVEINSTVLTQALRSKGKTHKKSKYSDLYDANKIDTKNYTAAQLMELVNFQGDRKHFQSLIRLHKIQYKKCRISAAETIQKLNSLNLDTSQYSSQELCTMIGYSGRPQSFKALLQKEDFPHAKSNKGRPKKAKKV